MRELPAWQNPAEIAQEAVADEDTQDGVEDGVGPGEGGADAQARRSPGATGGAARDERRVMMEAVAETTELEIGATIELLKERWPDAVSDDGRKGFSGILIEPKRLPEIALSIRDELGFDYLSSVTGVDYFGISDHMEVVYHAYRTSGGPALVFKAQTGRDDPQLPSLVNVWPGADFRSGRFTTCMASASRGIRICGASCCGRIRWPSDAQGLEGSLLRGGTQAI